MKLTTMLAATCLSFGFSSLSMATAVAAGSVLYLLPTLDDEAYVSQLAAAKEKAKQFPDVEFDFMAGSSRNVVLDLIAKIETAVARRVKVIVVDPGEAGEQLSPALRKAQSAGVMIVTTSTPIPGLEKAKARIEFNDKAGGVPGGQFMAKQLKAGDEVAIIRCFMGHPQMDARENGFLEGLEGSGVKIVAHGETKCDPAEGRTVMENWITAYPNLKGVLSDTDIALVGAVQAMKAANIDLVVVGYDGQQAVVKMIDEGDIVDATPIYPYWVFGELAVETAARLVAGEEVQEVVPVPVQGLITRENAKDFLKSK